MKLKIYQFCLWVTLANKIVFNIFLNGEEN